MATTSMASCFCVGKRPGCTCDGRCACACTCWKDKLDNTFDDKIFDDIFKMDQMDWLEEIKDPDLVPEGQKELHKTKGGKGVVGQAIAKDKKRKQPPNCS